MQPCKADGYFDVGPAGYLLSPCAQLRNTVARFRSSPHDLEAERRRWKTYDIRILRVVVYANNVHYYVTSCGRRNALFL